MNRQSTNEPPNLSPIHKSSAPNNPNFTPKQTTTLPPKTESGEFFVNPNPPTAEKPVHENILRKISNRWVIGTLLLILAGIVGFTLHEIVFNKITALTLVPANTEYYLTLSIKEHPQAKKAEELVNKLPAGEKILESLGDYSTELLGPQDPFEDIFRLSKDEIFLARLYPEPDQKVINFAGITDLLNIVELNRPKDARNELNKLTKDIDLYDSSEQNYNDSAIYNIKLKEKGTSNQSQFDIGPLNSNVTLPLSEGVFATPVKNFILASENVSDVKRSLDLSKIKSILGFNNSELKNLQNDESHKKLSKYFPKETLVRFYQNQPLSPYGDYLPLQSLGQSFISPQGVSSNPKERAETFTRVPQGLTITAEDNGMNITSYQLDIKNPDNPLNNPFKFEESLAARLPKKFAGISPAFYGEIKNYYQIYKDQIEQIKDVAENSDNRTQRENFKKSLDYLEESKKSFRKTFGIDYEKDLLTHLDSHVASIYNGGSANKSPEFLIVADIKDGKAVAESLSKITIPNYLKEVESRTQDYERTSDVIKIGVAIKKYMLDNKNLAPIKLSELAPKYLKTVPKDPVAKKSYTYTKSNNLKIAVIEAKLSDERTYSWSSSLGYGKYKGTAKPISILPVTPKKSLYKNITVYTLKLYSYQKFTLNMYFASTDKKLIILFSDIDQSLKDVVDYNGELKESLASGENWKTQFENKGEVGGIIYVEPIKFWGIIDYIQNIYPEYKSYISSDLETTFKGYLKTLKSIGTVVVKEKDVHITNTFIQVVELPDEEKKNIEEAVQRLLNFDKKGGYSSVLGIDTSNDTLELWKERIKRLFIPLAIR